MVLTFILKFLGGILGIIVTGIFIFLVIRLWDFIENKFWPNKQAGPEITQEELDDFLEWHRSTKRPCLEFKALDVRPESPSQSQIGGRPWVDEGFVWPKDSQGKHLHFVAQVNCSELGDFLNFPNKGLLLFFISSEGGLGLAENENPRGDTLIVFYPDLSKVNARSGELPYEIDRKNMFPFTNVDAFEYGRKVEFHRSPEMCAPLADWRFDKWDAMFNNRPGLEKYEQICEKRETNVPDHFIGGHAQFVQWDPRLTIEDWQKYDIPLLKLGMDNFIMFGDAGDANFLLSEKAFNDKQFDDYLFTWDCG